MQRLFTLNKLMQKSLPRVIIVASGADVANINTWLNNNNANSFCDYITVDNTIDSQKALLDNYNADVLVFNTTSPDYVDHAISKNLQCKWVHSLSAGVDKYCTSSYIKDQKNGITLTNAKGSFSQFLAEYALFGILWHSKRSDHWRSLQRQSNWTKGKVTFCGSQTVGIVGYGDIGYHTAKSIKGGLNMRVLALKRDINNVEEEKRQCVDELFDFSGLDRLCKESDYIISI